MFRSVRGPVQVTRGSTNTHSQCSGCPDGGIAVNVAGFEGGKGGKGGEASGLREIPTQYRPSGTQWALFGDRKSKKTATLTRYGPFCVDQLCLPAALEPGVASGATDGVQGVESDEQCAALEADPQPDMAQRRASRPVETIAMPIEFEEHLCSAAADHNAIYGNIRSA